MPERKNIAINTAVGINPAAYRLNEILLKNHKGRIVDISDLVTDFKIIESLYTPYLKLELNVKDNVNLFEEFQLSGQEKIQITYTKEDVEIGNVSIKRDFCVTDYPLYAKTANRQQVYSINAISEYMYISKFKQVSKAVDGEIKNIIRDLLVQELNIPEDSIEISAEFCTSFKGIIPNMSVYDAISWLIKRAYDSNGAPWYCYDTVFEGLKIVSHADVIELSKSPHRKYTDGKLFTKDPINNPDEYYRQQLSRLLDVSSDIKLSKFISGLSGAFASTTNYIDIATKTHYKDEYSYADEFDKMKWIDKHKVLSDNFKFENETIKLSEYKEAAENHISINSIAYDDKENYSSLAQLNRLNKAQARLELTGVLTQMIKIFGDPTLMSGKSLELQLTQSRDPEIDQQNFENTGSHIKDKMLSGNYLITGIEHLFGSEYYCNVRCKKDSFAYEV